MTRREKANHYDNSHEGNGCRIVEHWYWCEDLRVAVRLYKVFGRCYDEVQTATFDEVWPSMPSDVRDWFTDS